MKPVTMPMLKLRKYQKRVWNKLFSGVRYMFICWHRRGGKDLFCLNFLFTKASQEVGNYWYILPQKNQIRRAVWEGITSDGQKYLDFLPKEMIAKRDDQNMVIHLKHPAGGVDDKGKPRVGSVIFFLGGDRYDTLVGAGIKGCVISEWALQKPNLYDLVIEPMLRETKGWCLFNTTPRGENHAYDTLMWLKEEEDGYSSVLTIEDTGGFITKEDLDKERRRGKPEELIQQEYYCSFEGAIQGSYYGDILKQNKDKVTKVPYDGAYPVHTIWDLGISDSMAIWFVQFVGSAIHIIDYYEANGLGLAHYTTYLQKLPYAYKFHHIPHDGKQRQHTSTEKALTIEQQLKNLGLDNVKVHKRTNDVYGDIQAVRALLPRVYFDKEKTKTGYDALKQYRREFDEKRNCYKDSPLHDWTSHASDAFRVLPAIGLMANKPKVKAKRYGGKYR